MLDFLLADTEEQQQRGVRRQSLSAPASPQVASKRARKATALWNDYGQVAGEPVDADGGYVLGSDEEVAAAEETPDTGADNMSSVYNSSSGDQDQVAASGSGDTWPAGYRMASNSDLHKYDSLNLAVDAIHLASSGGADAAAFLPEDLAAPQGIAADLNGDDHGAFGAALFAGPFAMLAVAEDPDDFYGHIADAPLDLAPWPSAAAQHPSATVPAAAAAAAEAASATAAAAAALHARWQELQQQYHVHLCAPDDIDASTPLGEGGYATVYAGRYKGRDVAVKVVKVPAPQLGQQVDQEALRLEAELALVKELEAHLHAQRNAHPHIIRVVAYCREALAILLERCDTTLEARVKALRGQSQPQQHQQQPEQQQQQQHQECQWQVWLGVLSQLASAVCHLHSEGCLLLHNDLKAANVLLQGVSSGTDSTSWQLKVADFGVACKAESAHSVAGLQVPVSISHNPLWLAPELMVDGGVATLAADIYSLGCVMYEVLTGGRTPRVADDDRPDVVSLRVRIQAEERKLCPLEFPPDDMRMPCLRRSPPTDVENLFKACSSVDRAARPTAHDVLARLQHQCVC